MTDVFVQEVLDQPRLLRDRHGRREELEAVRRQGWGRLWLVGCGDMHMAAQSAAAVGECVFGGDVRALGSMDLRWWRHALRPDDLLVAASVSGRTPRTLEALRIAADAGARTLAVTDDPDSPLAAAATSMLPLESAPGADLQDHVYPGYSSEVPQTRTYLAVLHLFLSLVAPAGSERWDDDLPELLERYLEPLSGAAAVVAKQMALDKLQEVIVLGSGIHASTAAYGAAKLLEFAIPARAQCIEEFHHLEMFTVHAGTWLVAVTPDGPSARRFAEVRGVHEELGARTVEWTSGDAGPLPEVAAPASLFTTALALQWQAYHLAKELGRDVNRWVGGVRRDQIFRLSQRTIRDSVVDPGA